MLQNKNHRTITIPCDNALQSFTVATATSMCLRLYYDVTSGGIGDTEEKVSNLRVRERRPNHDEVFMGCRRKRRHFQAYKVKCSSQSSMKNQVIIVWRARLGHRGQPKPESSLIILSSRVFGILVHDPLCSRTAPKLKRFVHRNSEWYQRSHANWIARRGFACTLCHAPS